MQATGLKDLPAVRCHEVLDIGNNRKWKEGKISGPSEKVLGAGIVNPIMTEKREEGRCRRSTIANL